MSVGMNVVRIAGNLTRDPQVRATKTGKRVASFTVAVNRKVGEKEWTDFINVTAWDMLADAAGQNLHKGAPVVVDGWLSIRSYEAQDGSKRQAAEVVANVISAPISAKRAGESYPGDNLYPQSRTVADRADFGRFGASVYSGPEQEEIPF